MNSFIPLKPANIAIVDARISKEIEINLNKLGLHIIKTIKCEDVDESISYHPDIVIHPVNHDTLVIAPNVFDYYKKVLSGFNINLIKGEKVLKSKYPDDIAYNVGRLGNVAIHNFRYTDSIIKHYLQKQNIKFINVKQGYSKCSLAIIGENTAITSDYPMYNKLNDLGFELLLIKSGNIELKGEDYGFIGGTNGNLCNKEVIFSGSLINHPDRDKMFEFIKKNNINLNFLSKEKIVDMGTIITLNCH